VHQLRQEIRADESSAHATIKSLKTNLASAEKNGASAARIAAIRDRIHDTAAREQTRVSHLEYRISALDRSTASNNGINKSMGASTGNNQLLQKRTPTENP
jgi:hypothetical protein